MVEPCKNLAMLFWGGEAVCFPGEEAVMYCFYPWHGERTL